MEENGERYQFESLEAMDKAVRKAFGTRETELAHYEKGLIVVFHQTGSLLFDRAIRSQLIRNGGCFLSPKTIPEPVSTEDSVSPR